MDNGETVTMSMDKVEAFFDSVQRMKNAADPEARIRKKEAEEAQQFDLIRQQQREGLEKIRFEQIIRQQEMERTQIAHLQQQSRTWASAGTAGPAPYPLSDSSGNPLGDPTA